jgi:polyisoprenyl-teichoic acid--peptidoglycan teichoic acid transferase
MERMQAGRPDSVAHTNQMPHGRTSRRRRGRRVAFTLVLLLLLVLGAATLGGYLLWQRVEAFNKSVSTQPPLSGRLSDLLSGRDRVNVLLLGFADEDRPGAFLSDSISVLSIDPVADTTTAISIPRDVWIEGLPELPGNGKINEAFAIGHIDGGFTGAGDRAAAVVTAVTGLPIHGWLALDFSGFREMVEAVGGVTVNNPTEFGWAWDGASMERGELGGTFPVGPVKLDGPTALAYVRVRYTTVPAESSDFARAARQHRVLSAVRDKLGDGGVASLGPGLRLMDALQGELHTNLSVRDLYAMSSHLSPDRRVELAEGVILEATRNSVGQYILVVIGRSGPSDYQPLRDFIAAELARPLPSPTPGPS